MKSKKYSLYLALGIIIFTTVVTIMAVNSTFSYINTKERISKEIKQSSKKTILSIKDNIKNLIASYAVNEYNTLIYNEITRKDIFAIVINDYNMGRITGQESLVNGKIKYSESNIIDYDSNNKEQNEQLLNCFYSETYPITSLGEKIGTVSIFISDEKMKKELKNIILANIKNSIIFSLFLIIFLFITIRIYILKPISDIIETIGQRDEDGIPIRSISNNKLIEINNLSSSLNKMITSVKKSRSILKREQNKLESLLELSPIAVRVAKNNGENVIFANNAYSKLLHLNKSNTINNNPKDYYTDKLVYDEIMNTLNSGEGIYNKLVELTIENKTVWALSSYMNINFDGEDSIIGWFFDVTNEKNNENKLYEALELQTTIFDNSGYLIIRTDEKGIIKQINKETEHLLGYSSEEVIDKFTPEKFHLSLEIEQKANEFSEELNKKVEPSFEVFIIKSNLDMNNEHEWTFVTKDRKQIPVMLSIKPLKNKENEIYGYIGIARDISQNKLVESQARLASMGEMIGNIAHQWRQPLSIISTITTTTKVKSQLDLLEDDELLKDMDCITEQTQYLSKTIDDFRNFIENKNEIESVLISSIIEKSMNLLKSSMKNNTITTIIDIKVDLEIQAYENQLIQALINILNNSKDAIKENVKEIDERLIFITTKEVNKNLVLSIKDNGGGMEKDTISKIFEPYFTTKHKSIGTGIGLSMTYQIINNHHNASINVSNETYTYNQKEYTGANFEIIFKI